MSEVKMEGTGPTQAPVKYKFKELKVYSSDEWMADATKKYRQVYDRWETTYMRCEFSFYNKLFDEEDWDAAITLKCIFLNGSSPRELCSLPQTRKILKDENIVYIREAWGNPNSGAYWQKGNYAWEAYIDNKKVGEGKFYIEDIGQPKEGENLFFDVEHIKMFEGDGKAGSLPEKKYLSKFSHKETRFIWGEFAFKNKTNADYYAEVIFNFADDSGQLKGRAVQLIYVPVNTAGQVFKMFPAWGSETPGTWNNSTYTMEAVFMDNLIATVVFQGAEVFEEGGLNVITDSGQLLKTTVQKNSSGNSGLDNILFEALAELNALTGLDNIKTEVNEMVKLVRFYQESGKDIMNRFSLHTVFTGNPGTGKTTVARILAKIYKGLGILEKGHLIEVDRQGLVAGFVGQTAIKTGDKINEALGGILFIDEAYSLANEAGSQNDFGGESIQVILKRMEDMRGKFGVIVAGYTENMQDFINSNPGLRSRFDQYFLFDDYSDAHMVTISDALFTKEGMKLNDDAREHLKNYFNYLHLGRDKYFGNARTVRQVVGEVIKNQNLRLAAIKKEERTPEMLETVILDDVKEFQIKELNQRNSSLGFKIGKK